MYAMSREACPGTTFTIPFYLHAFDLTRKLRQKEKVTHFHRQNKQQFANWHAVPGVTFQPALGLSSASRSSEDHTKNFIHTYIHTCTFEPKYACVYIYIFVYSFWWVATPSCFQSIYPAGTLRTSCVNYRPSNTFRDSVITSSCEKKIRQDQRTEKLATDYQFALRRKSFLPSCLWFGKQIKWMSTLTDVPIKICICLHLT